MSKLIALCSAVRKFSHTDKRSGTTGYERKNKGEYEPKASKKIELLEVKVYMERNKSLLLSRLNSLAYLLNKPR